jgi:osmotically-inducible protein OsmY
MRNSKKWMLIGGVSAVMAATGFTGCATHSDERTASQRWGDSGTARRVKKELAKSPIYKFSDVGVSAFERTVQLNGFVNTEDQKRVAEEIAKGTVGVAQVINNISIKPETLAPTGRTAEANPPASPPVAKSSSPQS